jgi:hypothetical protein
MNEGVCEYAGSCGFGRYYTGCGNGQKLNCPMYLNLSRENEREMRQRIENFWRGIE